MSETRIETGDTVNVYFECVEVIIGAEVISVPYEAGDSWILRDTDGRVVYVQSFSKIVRINPYRVITRSNDNAKDTR
jgi:hypothetical protein